MLLKLADDHFVLNAPLLLNRLSEELPGSQDSAEAMTAQWTTFVSLATMSMASRLIPYTTEI